MPNLHLLENSNCLQPGKLISVSKAELEISHQLEVGHSINLGTWPSGGISQSSPLTALSYIEKISSSEVFLRVNKVFVIKSDIKLDLIIGLCRPQMLKRILETLACFKVRSLYIVKSENSPKSYLQTKVLKEENLEKHLKSGSMQAGFSYKPEVKVLEKFRSLFDTLPDEFPAQKLLAEFSTGSGINELFEAPPTILEKGLIAAIGPESGWSTREKEMFYKNQFYAINLAPSILRVDVAVIAILSQIHAFVNT